MGSRKKKVATAATAAVAVKSTPDAAALADHCNRVAHHLRRDLGERPGFEDGGAHPQHADVAKAVDELATDYIRPLNVPGKDEAIDRVVAQLRDIEDGQATELADALEA